MKRNLLLLVALFSSADVEGNRRWAILAWLSA